LPEYTGWDDYIIEQEQNRLKDENPILEARLSVIENKIERLQKYSMSDFNRIDDIEEILEYNQLRLPLAHGKRFVPSVFRI
jgi:hypothetical protein